MVGEPRALPYITSGQVDQGDDTIFASELTHRQNIAKGTAHLREVFSSCRKIFSFHSVPQTHFQQLQKLQPESHRSGLQNFSKGRVRLPKQMSLGKLPKEGERGGVIFNSKLYIADFGHLYRFFFRCFP